MSSVGWVNTWTAANKISGPLGIIFVNSWIDWTLERDELHACLKEKKK